MKDFYAHGVERKPVDGWHLLDEHEGTVPDLRTERSVVVESGLSPANRIVANFASEFCCGEWGYLARLWYDLGQKRIGEKVYNLYDELRI